MPRQIRSGDELRNLLSKASECRVVKRGDKVKIKLITSKMLYTYITDADQADQLLKDVKVSITNF